MQALALLLLLFLATVLVLVVAAIRYPRFEARAPARRFPPVRSEEDAQRLASQLLSEMSFWEKLDQLSGDIPLRRFCLRFAVGLLTRFGIPHIYSGRNTRLGIPPLAFSDGPRGVNVGSGRTDFPVTMARGASWDPSLEHRVGEAMGRELRAIGANYSGAVCVNLLRHPGWGRAQETYGEDSHHLGVMGTALTRGIQAHNVMACVKHFALNSIECSRFYVDVSVDERRLREVYLPHFKRIIQEGGAASVMSAYNRFRGEYCGHSRLLLTEILRDEWGFTGFVTSDWIHGVRDGVAGLTAGMDVEMPACRRYGRPLAKAISRGRLSQEVVDRSVQRVLATRMRFALAPDSQDYPSSLLAGPEHAALAREVAEQSAVLLKNEGVLPFDPAATKRLAVIGRMATLVNTGDRGSSQVRAPYVVTPAEGLSSYLGERDGEVLLHDGRDRASAAELAASADAAVIVVGYTADDEGEYFVLNPNRRGKAWRPSFFGGEGDRTDLGLRPEDRELLAAVGSVNPRTVVVLVVGSAVSVAGWGERVPAILLPFYSGMEGGNALARLLFGEVSPSGKLPFTLPADPADLPPFDPFAETADYADDHGYLRFDKGKLPVAYPFGHGLSYSRFSWSDLVVETPEIGPEDELRLSVTLRNDGPCAAAEVLQLYLGFPESAVERPVQLLRGFEKVYLAPGESRRLDFAVQSSELACYDPEARRWWVERMRYSLFVGNSSRSEAPLEGSFSVR
ncbi:MAG: glycoside hydrolase family 3 C-terminal domain-containing protein [Myxococcota bacterium]|nr:glycoside hydrolase family 3 C-terminal domain-containing protein [Myxococcota bacterium]